MPPKSVICLIILSSSVLKYIFNVLLELSPISFEYTSAQSEVLHTTIQGALFCLKSSLQYGELPL